MNPYAAAAQVATTPQGGNPRVTEAWALTEAGRRMASAARGEPRAMREALRLNWRLWTIFQADLTVSLEADPTNDLVVNMLTLCQFVDRHTVEALTNPTAERLEVLVGLNRQIAAGLTDSVQRESDAQAPGIAPAQPSAQQAPATSNYNNTGRTTSPYGGAQAAKSSSTSDPALPPGLSGSFSAIA